MLVLSRRRQETILIGENVEVKVIQTSRGTVRLGISAPQGVRIVRGELESEGPDRPRLARAG